MGIRVCVYLSSDLCVSCDSPSQKWIISRIEALPTTASISNAPAWTLRPLSTFASEIDRNCTVIQAGAGRALVRRTNGSWLEIRGSAQPRLLPASEVLPREDHYRRVQAADFGPQPWLDGDSSGLWLGSDRDGLIHLGPPAVEFWTHPQSTRSRSIQAIDASAEGSVWFTVEDRGDHSALHWRGGRFVGSNGPASFSSIVALQDGSAFASGNQFTYALTDVSIESRPLPSTSDRSHLSKGHSGRFWIASGTNLSESTNLRDWRPLELPRVPAIRNATWLSVLELTNRHLWIGSIGFGALHLSNGVPFLHNMSNGAPSNILNPSLEDPDGTIWFGSTEGLVRYRRGTWFRFGREHGLAESLALGVVDDLHGRLWVHGHQGVAGIHRSELEAVADGRSTQFRLFRPRDAAAWVTECNAGPPSSTRDSQGSLWFATIAGALRVPREQLVAIPRPAPTITSAADSGGVFWRDILKGSVRRLDCPPDADQVLDFTLANPGRAESQMAPIQYRLDGVDQSWSTAPADGRIRYHHLSAGRLTLRIRSAEGGDAAESAISLSIPTRWYNTWSFRTIAAGLFAALAGLYLQRRHARTRYLLEQEYRQQTQARRWQIARDLHDGIGVGLARISILASQSHPTLSTTAQRLIRDLDELVWLTDPQRDGLNSAINYLVAAAERQLQGLPIELRFQIPDSFPDIQISGEARRHLIQIVHGALSNVIKHSRATQVEFRIGTTPTGITLEFIDNGCGFDPLNQPAERSGLRSFRERSARLDGTFSFQTAPGQGTRLTFVLTYANLSADLIPGSLPPAV
jgi:signal transduction histidine kinase